MLKKLFILPEFGKPFGWNQLYFDHIRHLEKYGWHWLVPTPNQYESVGNIHILPMSIEEFDSLVFEKTGVCADNHLVNGVPRKFISDYYPAFAHIFEDYTRPYDFVGTCNWDQVFGRLDHFLPDTELCNFDIWTDEANDHINSLFCLYRNRWEVIHLYEKAEGWKDIFAKAEGLVGWDETEFYKTVRAAKGANYIRLGGTPYFPYHSYDRLIQHQPNPNLEIRPDGSLFELFTDPLAEGLKNYLPWQGRFGREIMHFHFSRTKTWPECLVKD